MEKSLSRSVCAGLAVAMIGCSPNGEGEKKEAAHGSSAFIATANDEPPCTGQELAVATSSLNAAKSAMDRAIPALRSNDANHVRRGQEWLGLRSSAESEAVRDILVRSRAFADGVTFRCARQSMPEDGEDWYAYVLPDRSFVVVVSPLFFAQPNQGLDSKAGTIVHEITHFTLAGATPDIAYRPEPARQLARTDPARAQKNAENIQFFVEAVAYGL